MKIVRIVVIVLVLAACVPVAGFLYYELVANSRVARELVEDPDGERARRVVLLTLPSGRQIPVNYILLPNPSDLSDQAPGTETVYAAADGRWWTELEGGARVEVLVRGQERSGLGRAVRDDPDYTARVFEKLRPNAIEGFGTLVEIRLDPPAR